MALAPILYNITFDSQTRILYFWDKAGHEIYHCEIPSPAPALPTVTRKSAQPFPYNSYINLSAGSESDLYVYESGSYRALGYDSNNLYSIYGCYSDTYYGGQGWIRGVLFDTVISQNTLKAKNITSSTIPYIDYFSVAICSSPDATIITVYDSSNTPYNAFKYTSDGTDYYYVLDGVQTDWTDDLSSIGYHVPPALPTVSNTMYLFNSSGGLNIGQINTLLDSNNNTVDYDTTACYACQKCMDSSGVAKNPTSLAIVNESGILKVTNISDNYISVYYVWTKKCSSNLATIITVYDSSNNPYNAFKYTSDGTDYYYVLDGTQTDWTDDLESIGYHVLSVAYLDIQDKYVNWNVWVWLYENSSASQTVSFDSNKRYIFDSAYTVNGSKVNLASHTITIGRPNSTYEILGLIDSYSGFAAYKVYYHAIPNS